MKYDNIDEIIDSLRMHDEPMTTMQSEQTVKTSPMQGVKGRSLNVAQAYRIRVIARWLLTISVIALVSYGAYWYITAYG